MSSTVTIDPVTRIEGHAKITIHLDDAGDVTDAQFHVTEFRGFEKFCEGRSFQEMPGITARVCGICPVSHLLASAKTGDAILGVQIPPTAAKLRRLMNWGQLVQSHALSFFHLSSPDLLLGMDSDPASRNIAGLLQADPETARDGILLRKFGQDLIRTLGGRSVHPSWAVPGGVRGPLTEEKRTTIREGLPDAMKVARKALDLMKSLLEKYEEEARVFGDFPSYFMGLVTPDGGLEHYDGLLRVIDSEGETASGFPERRRTPGDRPPGFDPARYRDVLEESVQPWSYLKFPFYKPGGSDRMSGMYRVGPLARLNVCTYAGTPQADTELREFRQMAPPGKPVTSSFHYHLARLIEIMHSLERIGEVLDDPTITDPNVRSSAGVNQTVAVGVSEAPRGTLFHEYHVDDHGVLQKVNLLIATGQNNMAMNETVRQIARRYVKGRELEEGMLNRVEAGIRAFDPCLSCSTHAIGKMPLQVQLVDTDGAVLQELTRE